MKKLFAILPFLALPMTSIAADRASDDTINGAINMLIPSYCTDVFIPDPPVEKAQNWHKKAETIISNCYQKAAQNTSVLPKDNPVYEKCLLADFLVRANRVTLNTDAKKAGKQPFISGSYFTNDSFQNRFNNLKKDIPSYEQDDYQNYMSKTLNTMGTRISETCARYLVHARNNKE